MISAPRRKKKREGIKFFERRNGILKSGGYRILSNPGPWNLKLAGRQVCMKTTMTYSLQRSEQLWSRALELIPCGTQTMSKGPYSYVNGVFPKYLQRGAGSHVFDVDGNEYIDYVLSLGPISLGHGYPTVVDAVRRQLEEGTTFSLMHPLEVEVAELLVKIIPCAQMVRYAKNGSDVTNAAVKLARVCTGREKIACCGYHGSHDWYVASTTRSQGVPSSLSELVLPFEFNRIDTLERLFKAHSGQIAGVMLEPVSKQLPREDFLQKVCDLTREEGALVIFDEIVTGFRWALGGAQEHFGVTPDLACFGKGIANGFPLAVLVGKREFMRRMEDLFFSMTFAGEVLSLAAARATIEEFQKRDVIGHIWRLTGQLREGITRLAEDLCPAARVTGEGPLCVLEFCDGEGQPSLPMLGLFMQEMIKRGILMPAAPRLSFSHSPEDIQKTLEADCEALGCVQEGLERGNVAELLEGQPPRPVFPGGAR